MIAVLAVHLVVAAACGALGARLGRNTFVLAALAPLTGAAWLATVTAQGVDGDPATQVLEWVPTLGLDLTFRVDAFSLLLGWLVTGIGVLILLYGRGYFGDRSDDGRIAATLVLFAGSMLGLVTTDNLLALYVFWELTTVTSYLLVGTEDRSGAARAAALRAVLVTGAGGLAMLGGFVLAGVDTGTFEISRILADPPTGTTLGVVAALVLVGAATKSAQFPFSFWLPGAMAAPTPISAYLHSATMVKAGVYLLARFSPTFAVLDWWQPVVVGIGLVTMIAGGWRALRQHDLKLLLAHGTVSQLGFLVVLLGAGQPELAFAGTTMLLAHALFKAALFLSVGAVDHATHTRDLRRLSGVGRRMPVVATVAVISGLSMAGIPPMLGFIGKEAALEGLLHEGGWYWVAIVGVVAGSILTVAYTARFLWGGFADKGLDECDDPVDLAALHAPSPSLVAPEVVLATITLAAGIVPALVDWLVGPAAESLVPGGGEEHLALWHGLGIALALSAVAIGGGLILFAQRRPFESLQRRSGDRSLAEEAYEGILVGMNRVADRVTGTLQNGSLPVYLGVILLTAVLLPLPALLGAVELPDLVGFDSPLQLVVAGIVVAAVAGIIGARRRFVAVLLLGAVGFCVSVLFVLQGAPDLALTQLLVETLSLVLFVIVLRNLPDRFDPPGRPVWLTGRIVRAGIAVSVGAFVLVFALTAAASRSTVPVAGEYLDRALPEGGGANVVNVILVDFRGFDTMGEVTVLAVAALGVASLVLAGAGAASGRPGRRRHADDADDGSRRAPTGPAGVAVDGDPGPPPRSLILDTCTKAIIPTAVVFGLYLLFVGHNAPGGGFSGGLVIGTALVLKWLADGRPRDLIRFPVVGPVLLGLGVGAVALTGMGAWLWDLPFLTHGKIELDLPVFHHVKLTSTLAFDIGVDLVVIGLVLTVLTTIGRERTPTDDGGDDGGDDDVVDDDPFVPVPVAAEAGP